MMPTLQTKEPALPDGLTMTASTPSQEPVIGPEPSPTPLLCRRPVRLTIYGLFVALFLLMLAWRFVPAMLDPTFEKHIQEKRVIVGMTREQVLKAWGSPYTINVSYTNDGTRREEWIFEDWKDASTVKHRYLYFEEGILVGGWYYQ